MFKGCSKLATIDLSIFSFCRAKYLDEMFHGCKSLETIIWPNELKCSLYELVNFGGFPPRFQIDEITNFDFSCNNMFFDCISLTSINLSTFYFKWNN